MRKFIHTLIPFVGLSMIFFAIMIAFSFTQTYSANFASERTAHQKIQGDLSSQTQLPLDAETLIGSNLMKTAASVFTDSLIMQNPQGPKIAASGTMQFTMNANITGSQMFDAGVAQVQSEIQTYTAADLTVVSDTQQSNAAYAQQFIAGVNLYMKQFRGKDLLQLSYAMETNNDADARKTLIAYVDASRHMIDYLKQVRVPRSWSAIQVLYMNVLSQARYTALAFLTQHNDPLRANIMTQNYPSLLVQYAEFEKMFGPQLQKTGFAM